MKKIPIIIDCDPGVDDSYAIALANSHPEFEIVALTAVEGNVPAVLTRHLTSVQRLHTALQFRW